MLNYHAGTHASPPGISFIDSVGGCTVAYECCYSFECLHFNEFSFANEIIALLQKSKQTVVVVVVVVLVGVKVNQLHVNLRFVQR